MRASLYRRSPAGDAAGALRGGVVRAAWAVACWCAVVARRGVESAG
ncbi:hypothetical protein QJS66_17370 [Kocuria rhizophila]|nr:hypothetical protein QJS66_17370 [Kocuria rhizophila]